MYGERAWVRALEGSLCEATFGGHQTPSQG